jgi:hypothetical protein
VDELLAEASARRVGSMARPHVTEPGVGSFLIICHHSSIHSLLRNFFSTYFHRISDSRYPPIDIEVDIEHLSIVLQAVAQRTSATACR